MWFDVEESRRLATEWVRVRIVGGKHDFFTLIMKKYPATSLSL